MQTAGDAVEQLGAELIVVRRNGSQVLTFETCPG
jgi:hypothetical protein